MYLRSTIGTTACGPMLPSRAHACARLRPSRQAASAQPDAGWKIYDFETEMNRLGVFQVLDTSERPAWRVYNNSDFTLSPTYPAQFVVPRQCSDAVRLRAPSLMSPVGLP